MRATGRQLAHLALTLGIGFGGCGGDGASAPVAEVFDSAGFRIVRYDLTHVPVPTYRVVGEPNLEIGERDGAPEYMFSGVPDVATAPDGSFVVSDALALELRVYDPSGTYLRTIGQQGEGPGEFASAPMVAGFAADTVFAFDSRSSRLTSFTMGGGLLGTSTLGSEQAGRPTFMIRQSDGSFLAQSPWVNPVPDLSLHDIRLELDSITIEHLDAGGASLDTLLVTADRSRLRLSQDAGDGRIRTMQAAPPFLPRAFLRSDGLRPIIARSDVFGLRLLGGSGEPETRLQVLGAENPLTGAEIRDRQEAALREEMGDAIDPRTWQLNVDYLPDRLQAFMNIVVSEEGDVWVALTEYDRSGGYDWFVFTPHGELRGSVHTPPEMSLHEVHADHIVGVAFDELDVPSVRRYPLLPGGAGA